MMERPGKAALTGRQRAVLDFVRAYCRATGEPCPATIIARRMALHHSTVQEHLYALHRKGFLRAPNAPAVPA